MKKINDALDFNKLRTFKMFKSIKDDKLKNLPKHIKVLKFESNESICKEDTPSTSMFFIEQGKVKVSKKGVEQAVLECGDYFGEMSLLEGRNRTASITAIEPTILYEMSSSAFEEDLKNSYEILYDIAVTYDHRLRKHNDRVIEQYLALQKQFEELKATHNQLLQTEKLASIGMLTSSISHEINNPLAIVMGFHEMLWKRFQEEKILNEDYKKIFRRLHKATESMSKIVSGLKSYVRMDSDEKTEFSINNVIEGSIDLVSYLYKKQQIFIETNLDNSNPVIIGSRGEFQQVIMNLLSNARDAMDERNIKKINIETGTDEEKVFVKVSDSGCGIEKDKVDKIFDKFYTTKPVGKGTGLGLDIIKSIVEKMNGNIEVESEIGVGSTFTIKFG